MEALNPSKMVPISASKMVPISVSNIYKVFGNLHMLWMCIWMCLYHVTLAPILQALENLPRTLGACQVIKNHVVP
jgi:hypothetical protein